MLIEPLLKAEKNGRKAFRIIELNGVTYWKVNEAYDDEENDDEAKDVSGDVKTVKQESDALDEKNFALERFLIFINNLLLVFGTSLSFIFLFVISLYILSVVLVYIYYW